MKRIDTKDGLFDDGNHVFGIHGTRVSAEFLNDIQEEIVNVIGAKNLDGSKRDQLITAIRNIVKSGGGSSSGSAITQADQDKIDSSYHKLKHFVEDELGIALDAKNDAQLKTAIDSAIAKLQAQLDVIKTEQLSQNNKINTIAQIDIRVGDNSTSIADIRKKMTNGSTETTAGVAEIATQQEANAGTDDNKIVTPKKLKVITSDLDRRATRIRNDVDANTVAIVKLNQGGGTTNVPLATETTAGKAEIATQQEANNGTDDSRIVTPKKLKVITSDLDRRATRIRNDVDRNTADLVTHRTDIQQNTTDIVSNTASIATIISTLKKGVIPTTADKLTKSFTVPTVLHDKVKVSGEDDAGHYGYAVAMHGDYLAVSDPVLQEVVIYQRDKNNKKIFNLEDIHKGKKHGAIFVEDGQVYAKRKDGKYLDVFEYDETQAILTFKKVNTINLTASYGNSLAIDDEYLIVGNPQANTALIYRYSGIHWQLVEKLSGGTSFGSDVAINHKYIVVSEVANKKAEVYKISSTFDFSAERVTGRFKVNVDVYLNAPTTSTTGFIGYTVADDDGVNFYQVVMPVGTTTVYTRTYTATTNGVYATTNIDWFYQITNVSSFGVVNQSKNPRIYFIENNKLYVGVYLEGSAEWALIYKDVSTNQIYTTYSGKKTTRNEIGVIFTEKDFNIIMSRTNRNFYSETSQEGRKEITDRFYHSERGSLAYKGDDHAYFSIEEKNGTKKQYNVTQDNITPTCFVRIKGLNGTWGAWSNANGTRPADLIQLKVSKYPLKKIKTLTGGASYSKLISGNNSLFAVAEPDNNILKIYENLAEIASKTVKADCVSAGKNIVLAASKTDKKAYLYDLFSKTGWFTTTRTKWYGLPDNAQGYAGYYIKGGKYQLVRLVGTTDTYTKYKGGAWVKNGAWGGVLWYLGSKIGFAAQNEDWKKIGQSISASFSEYKTGVQLSADGSIVSIGSHNTGYVGIYKLNSVNNTWEILGNRITRSGGFGISVSLSADGGTVSIGAHIAKYVETYKYNSGNNSWEILGNRITGSGNFGITVSLSADGGIVSIGAYTYNYVEAYKYNSGKNTWEMLGNRITGSGAFGVSVSLSADGGTVSIGAYTDNYVETYKYNNGKNTWEILGNRITGSGDFGRAVSLSADGGIVSIGAYTNSYIETYKLNSVNNTWEILGNRITGSGQFGWNMQLSKDGSTVAASADDSQYEEAYRYDKSSNSWKLRGKRRSLGKSNGGSQIALNEDGNVWAIGGTQASKVEVFSFLDKKIYIDTNDGKRYYGNKEVADDINFDSIMETVAPLPTLTDTIPQASRNLKLTNNDIQEQPNKTGNYVSLLGTGTATTAKNIDDINFTIDNNYGDACAITTDKILITNKTDSKLAIYDHLGTKQKEIQLETGVGSVIDATDTEAIVGSETANTVDVINLKI